MDIEIEAIGKQDKWSLNQSRISIGRGAKCDVNLPARHYPSVSGEHAVLEVVQGTLRLAIGSGSGGATYLNGRPAVAGTVVRTGDILRLGADGPELRVRIESWKDDVASSAYEPTRVIRVEQPSSHEATRVMSSTSGSSAESAVSASSVGRRRSPPDEPTRSVAAGEGAATRFSPGPQSAPAIPLGRGRSPQPAGEPQPAAPRAAAIDNGSRNPLEGQLNFMRNLMLANLALLVALALWAFQENRELAQNRKEIQALRMQAASAMGQLTPALDARLGVFEKRLDGLDGRLRAAQDHMEAGMETKMKTVQDQMTSAVDANMKVAEDRLVTRMNTEIPAMLDKYVNKKLADVKH